jgi:hypothetical protein
MSKAAIGTILRCAGFYKERTKFTACQILANNGTARGMSAVRLENVLGEIAADGPKRDLTDRHCGSRID